MTWPGGTSGIFLTTVPEPGAGAVAPLLAVAAGLLPRRRKTAPITRNEET